uniref:Uncharacterized protein n=1 Tax=Varanus komodoensis TaxID=61221 RepID=A0A8D2IQE3_VARKO
MGAAGSGPPPPEDGSPELLKAPGAGVLPEASWLRGWKTALSSISGTLLGLERALVARAPLKLGQAAEAEQLPPLPEKEGSERRLPQFISLFLPEFPIRPPVGERQLKILGFVAKGSFGTVLKVLDCRQEKVFAVKVSASGSPSALPALEASRPS